MPKALIRSKTSKAERGTEGRVDERERIAVEPRTDVISPPGRALRARMWPEYARALERAVGCRLDPGEAATLEKLLRRVAAEQAPDS